MEHSAHFVDLLDASGKIVGQKIRRDINKATDVYHTVFVFVVTPNGQLVLGKIPRRSDLPNLYVDLLGVPMATIRRSNETAQQAAVRGVTRELFIDNPHLLPIGEGMITFTDKRVQFASVFCLVAEKPSSHSLIDMPELIVLTPKQFRTMLHQQPNKIASSLQKLWQLYATKLPI